jgi:thiosulfate/3-mercaptopyruvate sulfurtransferase
MRQLFTTLLFITLFANLSPAQTIVQETNVHPSMIVSTEWLAKHLSDPDLVLLQVGEKNEYVTAHIPGAQFIALPDISTPSGQGLTLELAPIAQLEATFQKLGVSNRSRVVVYFSKDWVTPTARVFMTLDYLGLGDETSILDGGLPAWRAEGRDVTAAVTEPKPGNLKARPRKEIVVDAEWVKANLNKANVKILDARAAKFYTGAEVGRMPRGGHIPGAKSIPFSSLVEERNNKFKSTAALQELFQTAGVEKRDAVATYCHIGQQASLLYFVARYLGYNAHIYDGSFEDWSNRAELPVEKSEGVKSETRP